MRKNPRLVFGLVLIATALAVVFVYPGNISNTYRPWHLGLDLVGGSHLVYNVDLSKVGEADKSSVLNGLRDVIEKRVNLFGVSEPQVFVAQSGDRSELVVELAGIKEVSQAIQLIGATPSLDFREVEEIASSTNFIQTNITTITGEPDSHAERILVTDQANTAFVDYRLGDNSLKRLLLLVRDAMHKEWTIRARYQEQRGEWQQVQGGHLTPPTIKSLYEWEQSEAQWILKESY